MKFWGGKGGYPILRYFETQVKLQYFLRKLKQLTPPWVLFRLKSLVEGVGPRAFQEVRSGCKAASISVLAAVVLSATLGWSEPPCRKKVRSEFELCRNQHAFFHIFPKDFENGVPSLGETKGVTVLGALPVGYSGMSLRTGYFCWTNRWKTRQFEHVFSATWQSQSDHRGSGPKSLGENEKIDVWNTLEPWFSEQNKGWVKPWVPHHLEKGVEDISEVFPPWRAFRDAWHSMRLGSPHGRSCSDGFPWNTKMGPSKNEFR